jgi:hypothetical protein
MFKLSIDGGNPMIEEYDILDANLRKQSHAVFNSTLLGFAEALEVHFFWKENWVDWVAGAAQFRGHAAFLKEVGAAADRGDSAKKAEREAGRSMAQLHIDTAVKYMVVRAVHKQDPTLLHNVALPFKSRPHKSAMRVYGATAPIHLGVKHVKGKSGHILITGRHVRNGGPYLLQICKGEPTSEESWYSPGGHYISCSKIVVQGLEPANRYFFRMRTDGPDGPGPWCQPVSIIVL